MPCCSIIGSYDGRCAYICVDTTSSTSCLSRQFVEEQRLGVTVQNICGVAHCTSSATLNVPTVGGFYTSHFPMPLRGLAKFDVLLGADWVEAVGAIFEPNGLALSKPQGLVFGDLQMWRSNVAPPSFEPTRWFPGLEHSAKEPAAANPFQLVFEGTLSKRVSVTTPPPREFIRPLEIPFDIAYYIVAQLTSSRHPLSISVDSSTLYALCLVSQSFNAAAIPILYSSITVSGFTAPRLAATARDNPSLLSHCHTLCFIKPGPVSWDIVAQIVCSSPELRRFFWLQNEPGLMKISMLQGHHVQITDLAFPDKPIESLAFSHAHTFPHLERVVLRHVHFDLPSVVDILIQMPKLTHLVSAWNWAIPLGVQHDGYVKGLATVVRLTALRRIIIVSTIVPPQSSYAFIPQLQKLLPQNRRNVEVAFLVDKQPGAGQWGTSRVEESIMDGTVWDTKTAPVL